MKQHLQQQQYRYMSVYYRMSIKLVSIRKGRHIIGIYVSNAFDLSLSFFFSFHFILFYNMVREKEIITLLIDSLIFVVLNFNTIVYNNDDTRM